MSISRILIAILTLSLTINTVFAQAAAGGGDVDAFVQDTKTDLLIVVAGGLAGAVLGLSTLSFVDEPKEHTRNILVGSSLGIILGVGYVAFNQANRSRTMFYEDGGEAPTTRISGEKFNTIARQQWHSSEIAERQTMVSTLNQIGLTFTY